MVGGHRSGESLAGRIILGSRSLGRRLDDLSRAARVLDEQRRGEVDLEQDVEPEGPGQLERALEQHARRAPVLSPERTAAARGEPLCGAGGELIRRLAELAAVADGLLEVVADDLVQLNELLVGVEPLREALVELSPNALWERVVSRVADQEVAEAKAVVARQLRAVGSDELPPHERSQARRHLSLLRCKRLHRTPVEELALDRSPLQHPPLGLVQPVEPRCEQGLQRRRHFDVLLLARHRQHLRDEERVPARSVRDPIAQLPGRLVADQLVGLVLAQRLEPEHAWPGRPALEQLRPRHADQQQRRPARKQRRGLDQVKEGLLAPLDVVEDDDERRLLLEQLAERPGDLIGVRALVALAEQRPDGRSDSGIGRQRADLLHHFDHRPIRDALPVGQAAAAHDARIDP